VTFLAELEGRATDWLFLHGRPSPPGPSDRIVHCDIDDSSIETVGRWPWPRSVLAEAVEELDTLGARVILLDLILADPQEPEYHADGTLVDHDAILAETLGRVSARTILAATVDTEAARLGNLWQGAEGRRKWDEIRALLRRDITLDDEEIARAAGLDGPRAARVQGRLLGIKALVAREVAEEMRREGRSCTEGEMRARLLPAWKNARLREFPSLAVIRAAVRNAQALDAMDAKLPRARPGQRYLGAGLIVPPLPAFARAAAAVGVVNSLQDSDGQLRRLLVRWEADGTVLPQLGLAAAAVFLGTPKDALASPCLEIGDLRLEDEEMLLSWPAIDPSRVDFGLHPHISLGRVIDIRRAEGRLALQEEERDELARELLAAFLSDEFAAEDYRDAQRRREIELELLSEAELRLPHEGAEEEEKQEEDREKLRRLRRWVRLREETAGARRELLRARAQLHGVIHGRLVLVGWNATGNFGDFFPTAAHERTPGVVAHAIVANSALTGYAVRPMGAWAGTALTLVLGAAAAFLASATGPRLSFLLALLLGLLAFAAAIALFSARIVPPLATPLLGVFASWAGVVTMRAVQVLREKAQLRRQFGARISPQLFKYLIDHPDQVSLEGEEKEVTCFFSDLAGFTSISERLDSRQTVALLNRYMAAMNDELTRREAYVNKFLGDGIMAVWGAFASDPRQVELACRAALACVNRLEQITGELESRGLPRLSMRVGIATGVGTVGDCGAPPELRDYTVIGNTANLAARLESANKQFGTRILIDGRTRELLPDDLLTRPLGHVAVVGQEQATDLHELVAERGRETPEQRDLIERTPRAVELFRGGDLEGATGAWRGIVARHGSSPAADLYLAELAARLAERGPPEPVLRLSKK
jgi:class 3 adenylate cyclase/CHASE2 domain-containing sensor protein